MERLLAIYKQQLQNLEGRLTNTTNPIEYIRLDSQLMILSDCIRLVEQVIQQEKSTKENG